MSRRKIALWALFAVVFLIGAFTLAQQLGAITSHLTEGLVKPKPSTQVASAEVTDVNNANFAYLVPGVDDSWQMDDSTTAYDKARGVVKYLVKLKYAQTEITFSQQVLPDALKPRDSAEFNKFISASRVSSSTSAGNGKVYFLEALENGQPATTGADTIIFANDDILMFGRANRLVKYDVWTKLLGSMRVR